MHKEPKRYFSLRIPEDGYEYLKSLTQASRRSIVSELMMILDEHKLQFTPNKRSIKSVISELSGIVDEGLEYNYSETYKK